MPRKYSNAWVARLGLPHHVSDHNRSLTGEVWSSRAQARTTVGREFPIGSVAKLHWRRCVLWSLPVTYGTQRGRVTMAISFKGAHFPPDSILMRVRWSVAYPLSYRHVEE